MSSSQEVPPINNPAGVGRAVVTITGTQVCVTIQFTGVGTSFTGFHIHFGIAGVTGPVVIPLTPPTGNTSVQCVNAGSVAAQLAAHPTSYYINLHTAEHPPGVLRGQFQPA